MTRHVGYLSALAWSKGVNATQRGVDWQIEIEDARRKLRSVYPTIEL
jgi:hypothetical protein